MFSVRADPEKNRLYIVLGRMEPGEDKGAARTVSREVWKLRPGFTVVNDLTEYVPVDQESALHIRRAQKVLVKAGMAKGVRVVRSKLAEIQFERRAREIGYDADNVSSLAEAERVLDRWVAAQKQKPDTGGKAPEKPA